VALTDLLRSGINNLNSVASNASSGLQSFDTNQFNQTLTRGAGQLGGNLAQAGGLLEQAGSLSSSASSVLSQLNVSSLTSTRTFSNLDQIFEGKIENLTSANVVSTVDSITGSVTNTIEGTNIQSVFRQDRISQTLNGIRQNISVLPEQFNSVTSSVSEITGAVQDLSTAASSVPGALQEALGGTALYDDAILRALRIPNRGNGNRSDTPNDFEFTPSESGTGARIKNPLRDYASYTYNLELSVLSPFEINSPEDSYRNGVTNSIVRSGGGNYSNRVTTFNEDVFGKHAEYYIDDVELTALMSPNPNTGVTQGTSIRFSVTEPYSMGQFLEALAVGANQAGYNSYIEAPYLLKISFKGIDQDGRIINDRAAPPKFIPIKLTNIEFEVKAEGSVYQCEAIPYNEMALTSQTSIVRTDVNISGRTVAEALQTGNPSNPRQPPLTDILNGRGQSLADAGVYNSPDRYIIMFPTDSQGATRAVSSAREADFGRQQGATTSPTITETEASQLGGGLFNVLRAQGTEVIPDGAVYDVLRNYAANNINEIGRSPVIQDVNQDGDRTPSPHAGTIDEETGIVNRSSSGAQMDETTRNALYTQNTSIISIIEDMVLSSEYGRRLTEQQNTDEGLREWFRIETQLYIEEDPATQVQRGTPPRIFVYSVIPYFPDESRFQGASRRSGNAETLKNLAVKEYNYYYTGLNEDVLDFQIDFKTAFFQNLFADLGQHSAALRTGATGETVAPNQLDFTQTAPPGIGPVSNGQLSEPAPATEEVTRSTDHANGGQRLSASVAAKRSIAQAFHDTLINSNVDLINAEMEIWGDPFWIPESGTGNYNAAPSNINPNLTADGTVTGQHSDIFVVINFRTPFDYNSNS
jgi:hypothetical protein